ncbi:MULTISPECIES: sulfurtransferase [Leptolyngbya]|uniref:sulfurtransferase n=1 Tax=Leptolyngbya TaxID=47251 RepID=UPI001688F849|nr:MULTISPECIES: sulfurtransferase [unclassified Leptolyngbya]MBD1857123.1 sulfurtransferase [Leptolyngbya sp. FACHB-1624]MBN8558909.1 sulfurtransferase [Leptolyngbya sp. UWPOB_LEPTO1]MCY6488893.1 sulfurtransferase [Leptolyngbya sp. GGD]
MRHTFFWTRLRKPKFFALAAAIAIAFAVIPGMASFAASPKSTIQFVSPSWVSANVNDPNLRILDVRTSPLDYVEGHLPKAVNIADSNFRGPNGFLPVQYWDTNKLASLFTQAGVTNKSKVLVYSDGRDVLGATMVAYLLERSGVRDIAVLDGGYAGYKAANQPVTKEFPRYRPSQFALRDNPSIRVDLNGVKQLINKPGVVFIDPRPPELFRGEKNIWVRNGHIPGARNIPWPTFTESNNAQDALKNPHKLKSLDEIRKLLADRNIKPSDNIIVSCSTGREATLQYVVLKHLLGYPNVRIYEGSWTEYSTTDLPVATGPEQAV